MLRSMDLTSFDTLWMTVSEVRPLREKITDVMFYYLETEKQYE